MINFKRGDTALMWAAHYGRTEYMIMLINKGANIDFQNHVRQLIITVKKNTKTFSFPLYLFTYLFIFKTLL